MKTSANKYIYQFEEALSFFWGTIPNVSDTASETLASAELRAFDEEFLVMDIGPGVCAYKYAQRQAVLNAWSLFTLHLFSSNGLKWQVEGR